MGTVGLRTCMSKSHPPRCTCITLDWTRSLWIQLYLCTTLCVDTTPGVFKCTSMRSGVVHRCSCTYRCPAPTKNILEYSGRFLCTSNMSYYMFNSHESCLNRIKETGRDRPLAAPTSRLILARSKTGSPSQPVRPAIASWLRLSDFISRSPSEEL